MRSIRLLAAATSILVLGSGCGSDGGGVEPGNTAPVAAFTAPTCTPGAACTFTDASTDAEGNETITTRTWEFGDGNTGSGATAANTYTSAGTYNVKLTVTDNTGLTGTVTKPVTVAAGTNSLPTAEFDLPSCTAGTPCGFQSGATDTDGTIADADTRWNFGDTSAEETGINVTHTFAAPGTYNVVLTVTDNAGGTGTVTHALTVTPPASQDCTTAGTSVNCTLGITQRATVKITIVSNDCELAGDKLTIVFSPTVQQTAFFNICNQAVGSEYTVQNDPKTAPRVFEAGTTLPLRFTQGPQGDNPPVSDPGIRVSGSYPNWTLNVDDGGAAGTPGEPDFNDVVLSVQATAAP
jgi:PKD repeat protein